MPHWKPTYKTRRSTRILTFAVKQNHHMLNHGGEACFLLKRFSRANSVFQKESRRISTITKTASSYSADPDTGNLRCKLWGASTDPVDEYPDIGVFTATVTASGGTSVWEQTVDKYSFISDEEEYAFDIYQDEVDSDLNPIEDAVYIVFNTPPFTTSNNCIFTYGTINPLVDFEQMQPVRDNQTGFQRSLFGFEQWKKANARIRNKIAPHRFLLAFPGVLSDFSITEAGMLRETRGTFWTSPPPYSPSAVEHDVVVREETGQRFQIVNFTPIYVENILVQQHFDMVELDPRSSIYNVSIETT